MITLPYVLRLHSGIIDCMLRIYLFDCTVNKLYLCFVATLGN